MRLLKPKGRVARARARAIKRGKVCDCGLPAVRFHSGSYICARCTALDSQRRRDEVLGRVNQTGGRNLETAKTK